MSDEADIPAEQADLSPDEKAQNIAHEYVKNTKQWSSDEYDLDILKRDDIIIIDAVHQDDLKGSKSPNKSIQLHIDLSVGQVVRELAYQ
ncbi:MAG: hypothetical protein V2J55_13145 [Candidatus Competibacteraceae bacterium]|jgi:hypothetical protein|nr:hypothetical protein [Candidatus Competibacteraceae bacterium]